MEPAIQLSKLDLRSRETAFERREKGPAIVSGQSGRQQAVPLVLDWEKPSMSMDGKLTAEQISSIKDWINQGALWEATALESRTPALTGGARGHADLAEQRAYWASKNPCGVPCRGLVRARNPSIVSGAEAPGKKAESGSASRSHHAAAGAPTWI